jgi:small subunit ribosomal protein S18
LKEGTPMAFNKGDKADASKVRRGGMRRRKKVCVFCGEKNGTIDYKDTNKLKRYVSERGKEESQETVQSTRELLQ